MSWKLRGGHKQETSEGYNLLNFISLIGQTETTNGVTYKINEDGSITLNGTPTEYTSFNLANLSLEAGTYKFSDGQNNNLVFLQAIGQWNTTSQNKVFSVTENGNSYIYLVVEVGASTLSNFTLYPMIHEGTEDKPYEPYGIIKPSPQYPSKIDTVVGNNINLLNNTLQSQTINGLEVTVNSDKSVKVVGRTTEATTLIFSQSISTLGKGTYTVKDCGTYIESEENHGSWNSEETRTFTKDATISTSGFYKYYAPDQVVNETLYPKLVEGSTVTPYSPPGVGSIEMSITNSDSSKTQTITMQLQQEMLEGDYIEDVEHHEWGKIESYNNEEINTEYISTTG